MRSFMMVIALAISSSLIHAQKNYAVMVRDSKTGNPIKGASVKIKSTGQVVATSESGNVVIFTYPDDSLQVKFKDYKDRVIPLAGQSVAVSIEMERKPNKVATKPKKIH